jgi:predicted metal-dependent hydrolase
MDIQDAMKHAFNALGINQKEIDPKAEKEQRIRNYRIANKSRWGSFLWKTRARRVNEERYKFYKSKGNIRKTDIYARKLGLV